MSSANGYDVFTLEASGVADVAFSPDQSLLYAAMANGDIEVFDVATHQKIATWHVGTSLAGLSLSPDGSFLLVVESQPAAGASTLYQVNTATGHVDAYSRATGSGNSAFYDVEVVDAHTAVLTGGGQNTDTLFNLDTKSFSPLSGSVYDPNHAAALVEDNHYTLISELGMSPGPLYLFDDRTDTIVASVGGYVPGAYSGLNLGNSAISEAAGLIVQPVYYGDLNVFDLNLNFVRSVSLSSGSNLQGPIEGLAFDPSGAYLYAWLTGNGVIDKIDTQTWTVVSQLTVGSSGSSINGTYNDQLLVNSTGNVFTLLFPYGSLRLVTATDAYLTGPTSGDDTIAGGVNPDTLSGGGGNDILYGRDGDDTLDGGTGQDSLYGEEGNDTLIGGAGGDILDGGNGSDLLFSHARTAGVTGTFSPFGLSTDTGTEHDVLTGAAGDDVIFAGYGDDVDGGPNDFTGDKLSISLLGAASGVTADFRQLANGGTMILGGGTISGIEDVFGVEGSNYDDVIYAFAGGTASIEIVYGRGGNDYIAAGAANGGLFGGDGDDTLDATAASSGMSLNGEAGDDILIGWNSTQMRGGIGNDIYFVNTNSAVVVENAGEGTDEVRTALASYTLGVNVENLTGLASTGQTLTGNGLDNRIVGNSGADTLDGGGGNDVLDGGVGGDMMSGGTGNDIYYVDNGSDSVTENAGEGTDEVRTTLASYTLGANVENLTGLLATGQALTGNGLANVITGGSGNDTIGGGAGADTFYLQQGGADTVSGGDGNDVAYFGGAYTGADTFDGGLNADTLVLQGSYSGLHLSGLSIVSVETIRLLSAADASFGNASGGSAFYDIAADPGLAAMTIDASGLAAGEALHFDGTANTVSTIVVKGGAGNDVYTIGSYHQSAVEQAGGGIDEIRTALDYYVLPQNVENLTETSNVDADLEGNGLGNLITGAGGADFILGNGGDDVLHGADGDDLILGGTGNDILYGEAGADYLRGDAGNDQLFGGDGDDILRGSSGVDSFDGGSDDGALNEFSGYGDRVSFFEADATQGVVADLRTGIISNDGYGNVETMTGIESLGQGTAFADTFFGNDASNSLLGAFGDSLYGFGGNDAFSLGGAAAIVDGGAGVDWMLLISSGGFYLPDPGGVGHAVLSPAMTSGWTVDLAAGTLRDGYGNAGTVTGIENVTGSDLGDTIGGDGGDNVLDGGAGIDTLSYANAAAGVTVSLAVAGPQNTVGAGTDTISHFENLTGSAYADHLSGDDGANLIDGGAGADTMVGGTGNDIYYVDNAGDIVTESAGEGYDEVRTTIANYVLPANVEKLTYIGNGNFTYTGGGGNDDVAGNSGNDFFDLSQGGADKASGGGGNDAFAFGAAFGAGDVVDGGAGTDTVGISGDYTGANKLSIAAGQLTGIETLAMLPGAGGAAGYDIAWADGNLAAGQKMIIFAGNLQAGENLSFDGSAETHGFFVMYGGLGTDDMKGGAGSDGFYFGPGKFSQADHVDGGGGAQNQLGLDGSYDFSNGSALGTLGGNFSNIQTIALFAGDPRDASSPFPNTYHIVTNDAAVAAGKLLTIFGTPVISNFVFDGSAESDGSFRIFSGTGDDILTGGHGNDILYGNLGADTMTGGAGNDIFLYTDTAQSTAAKTDHIMDFDAGDHIDLSQIDADTTQSGDQAFAFIGSDAFGHHAGELRAELANGVWTIQGDTDGDGNADFTLLVTTVNGHQMAGTDFVP